MAVYASPGTGEFQTCAGGNGMLHGMAPEYLNQLLPVSSAIRSTPCTFSRHLHSSCSSRHIVWQPCMHWPSLVSCCNRNRLMHGTLCLQYPSPSIACLSATSMAKDIPVSTVTSRHHHIRHYILCYRADFELAIHWLINWLIENIEQIPAGCCMRHFRPSWLNNFIQTSVFVHVFFFFFIICYRFRWTKMLLLLRPRDLN